MADCDHAPLAPSSADRNIMCVGSRRLAALHPSEETLDSRDGVAAHFGLAQLLTRNDIDVGQVADNGVTLNTEMVECSELVADYINQRDGESSPRDVEQMIKNPILHRENYGTPDYVAVLPHGLFVDDYKHGHKYVEAHNNYQLANYALLKIADLARHGVHLDKNFKVTMTIHQPRCYHRGSAHRSWSSTVSELLYDFAPHMRKQYEWAMEDDAPVMATDPAICEHCTARHDCEAAAAAAYSAYEHGYSSIPLNMSPQARALELRILKRAHLQLKARITGLEEHVMRDIQRPGGSPGWRVEHGNGRIVWRDDKPVNVIINTARALGVDIATPGICTPAQALKKGLQTEIVNSFAHRSSGKAELVEDDGAFASRVFGGTR